MIVRGMQIPTKSGTEDSAARRKPHPRRGRFQFKLVRALLASRGWSGHCSGMAKRNRMIIAILAAMLLVLPLWTSLPRPVPEPVYDGKPLGEWLVQLKDADKQIERDQAALAVRHIGTNAIPTLLLMLRSEESSFKSKFLAFRHGWYDPFGWHFSFGGPANSLARAEAGFHELGPDAVIAAPELAKILDENRSHELERRTASILGNIGPGAKAAVPALLRAATSTNTVEHYYEFDALGRIHAEPELVIPVLINVMSHSPADRIYAVTAARQFGGAAKAAVPELIALLNDPTVKASSGNGFVSDREQVERALREIDPETYSPAITNTGPISTR